MSDLFKSSSDKSMNVIDSEATVKDSNPILATVDIDLEAEYWPDLLNIVSNMLEDSDFTRTMHNKALKSYTKKDPPYI